MSNFVDSYPGIDFSGYIDKIKSKKILILGVGTGGSYLLEALIKLGLNNFVIVDGDVVEKRNLSAQNYSYNNVNDFKVIILKEKYKSENVNIQAISNKISSYEQLSSYVDLKEIDYFINCADDYKLQIDLMKHLFKINPNLIMTYGGYSYLIQTEDVITKKNYKKIMKQQNSLYKSINPSNYVDCNSGSIFNGLISAFSIPKIIFDDLIGSKKSGFVGNFLLDDYKIE